MVHRPPLKPRHHLAVRRQGGALPRWLLWGSGALAAFALLWTLAIGWWLPRFLQPRLEAQATEALGAPLALERIEIAPWGLEARVHGLRLGPAEAPWLQVAEVVADVSSESLWRLAPVLSSLTVRAPKLELERGAPGRFNITPMLEALARRPPAPADAEPTRFALHNIRVEAGSARFVDRVAGSEHRVEALQLGIPFVSNLPSKVQIDVEPLLDARVNGSRLQLRGKTQPFTAGLRSDVDVEWLQLDLPRWLEALAPLLPAALPAELSEGRLDLHLKLAFERGAAPAPNALQVRGGAVLSQLRARLPQQGVQLQWQQLAVEGLDLRPLERRAVIGSVKLQAPQVELDLPTLRAQPSAPRSDRLVRSPPVAAAPASAPASAASASTAPAAPAAPAPAWLWRVDRIELADGRVGLRDPAWPEGGRTLTPISLSVAGLDAQANAAPANWTLALADAQGLQARLVGTLDVAARSAALKADVSGLQPAAWLAPWQALLPVQVRQGLLGLTLQAEASPAAWRISEGALQLSDLQLRPAGSDRETLPAPKARAARAATAADALALRRLDVSGIALRGGAGPLQAEIESVQLDGLDLRASRGERGAIGWLPPRAAGDATAAATPAGAAVSPPQWRVGTLRCGGCAVAVTDRSVAPAVSFGLARGELALRRLGSDLAQPIDFEFSAQPQRGGSLRLRGEVRPQPLALRSRVDVSALDLRVLQPYIAPMVNIALVSAKASAAGELRAEGSARELLGSLRWRGRLALNELRALDQTNAAEFLRFKGLSLSDADIVWRPDALQADLGAVALEDFYGRLIINADGRINLRDIVRREGEAPGRSLTTPSQGEGAAAPGGAPPGAAPPASEPAASAAAAAPAATPPQLRWRGIRIARGDIDFTDNFIRPNYSARLTDVEGEVSALAWNDPQPATVRVSGKVDDAAPLEIGGTVHPLGPRLATDITANARGIDITRLSAYARRYAGYGIEKGTLSVKVRYKIENGKLEAENNVYLDQLTFGAKVDSPDALKLPVLLAVSLLKDRNGVIDVNLPISGSLDDPQFSIGGIVVRVIVNLVTKAITAPFSLLAGAFGGGGQELGYVEFEPGSNELGEAGRQRLDTLAKALNDRPALKLEATGRADPALDEPALRRAQVERQLRIAKAQSSGEPPDSVRVEPAERTRWLEAAYKAAEIKDKPRNLIGLAKGLPPAEMEALLLRNAGVGDEQLRALANQRGDRVKAYLSEKVPPERVLLSASKLGTDGIDDKGRTTRVGFSLK